jgi:hypothetical protein
MSDDELLKQANERLADWNYRAKQWYLIYYALGALTVILTITVASRPDFIPKEPVSVWPSTLAWLAAIFQGMSTFFVALPKAAAYRAAWRILWLARLDYNESQQSDETKVFLLQAIARGWAMIDSGYSDAFRAGQHHAPSQPRQPERHQPGHRQSDPRRPDERPAE